MRAASASFAGIGATELQRDRMLDFGEAEEPRAIAVDHGIGRHHFGIEQRALRQLTVEDAAMPVRPIHHGRNAKSVA